MKISNISSGCQYTR